MPSNCPSSPSAFNADAFNITEWITQRYPDPPNDEDRERLKLCWGYTDCGDCHRSKGFCGWCALSQTCLPLPTDPLSRTFPLLSPMRYKFICATGPERFELRTSGLGCQVSTITFLACFVTIFCTLFGVLVLWGLGKCVKGVVRAERGRKGGLVLFGDGRTEVWGRSSHWGKWWRGLLGRQREDEVEVVDGGTGERSWWLWRAVRTGDEGVNANADQAERRPLLAE